MSSNKKKKNASENTEENVTKLSEEPEDEKEVSAENGEPEYVSSASAADLLNDVVASEKKSRKKKSQSDDEDEDGAASGDEDSVEGSSEDVKTEKKKKPKKEHKKMKHSAIAVVYMVIFVAVVVVLNIVASFIFNKYPLTFDLTSNDTYSISEEAKEYVKTIETDVRFRVFADESDFSGLNDYTRQASEVLSNYAKYNSHITVEYISIDDNPDIVSEYEDYTISTYTIIVEAESVDENGNVLKDEDGNTAMRTRQISLLDLIEFTDDMEESVSEYYSMSASDYALSYFGDETSAFYYSVYYGWVQASTADEAFVSALMAVTDPNPVVVAVLTGRNEAFTCSYLQEMLNLNGYTVEEVDITSEEIPDDVDLCIIPCPTSDYMEAEVSKVDDFLYNNGNLGKNLIYIAYYEQADTPNLDEFLAEYYLEVGDGYICENDTSYYYTYPYITIADEISDTFADDIDVDSSQLICLAGSPVTLLAEGEKGWYTVEALVQSTANAYVYDEETEDSTETGQQTYVALSTRYTSSDDDNNGTYQSNLLVVGGGAMLADSYLKYNQYQNREYFLSLINEMTGKTSVGITIEPKVITGNIFDITETQVRNLKIVFIGVIPALTLIIGLVIWLRRKNR